MADDVGWGHSANEWNEVRNKRWKNSFDWWKSWRQPECNIRCKRNCTRLFTCSYNWKMNNKRTKGKTCEKEIIESKKYTKIRITKSLLTIFRKLICSFVEFSVRWISSTWDWRSLFIFFSVRIRCRTLSFSSNEQLWYQEKIAVNCFHDCGWHRANVYAIHFQNDWR